MAIAHHNMWRLRYTNHSNVLEESILDLLDIDAKVYEKEDLVDIKDILPIFKKFPKMYSVVQFNKALVGYIAAYPISEMTAEKILKSGMNYDTDISDEEVDINSKSLYLSSAAIVPEHQDSYAVVSLLSAFLRNISDISDNGNKYSRIIANVVSEKGNKFFSRLGFKEELITSMRNTLLMSVNIKDLIKDRRR